MKRILLISVILAAMLLSACGTLAVTEQPAAPTAPETESPPVPETKQPTVTMYTLSTSISPSGAGLLAPSGGEYEEGTVVTITAIANEGYAFDHWEGDAEGSDATATLTLDSDKNAFACFKTTDSETPIAPPSTEESTVTPEVEDSSTQSPPEEGETSRDDDEIPPDDDVGSPIVNIDAPCPSPTSDSTLNFSGTAIDTDSHIVFVEYRIDTGAWTMAEATDGDFDELIEDYTFTTPSLVDGEHTIGARAIDASGNITASYAQTNITVDTMPPTVPTGVVKTSPDNATTPTFAWDAATDVTSSVNYYEVSIDSTDYTNVGNVLIFSSSSALIDGDHTFRVRAVDQAANVGDVASLNFIVNIGDPEFVIRWTEDYVSDGGEYYNIRGEIENVGGAPATIDRIYATFYDPDGNAFEWFSAGTGGDFTGWRCSYLEPGERGLFWIKAWNAAQESPSNIERIIEYGEIYEITVEFTEVEFRNERVEILSHTSHIDENGRFCISAEVEKESEGGFHPSIVAILYNTEGVPLKTVRGYSPEKSVGVHSITIIIDDDTWGVPADDIASYFLQSDHNLLI